MVSARNGKAAAGKSRAGSSKHPTASSSSPAPPQPQKVQSPAQASSSKEGMKTRQKRVLPARSRRGGPGVGTCETDVMILETMKRKFESEPLIPTTTRFLLTTNSALVPPATASGSGSLEEHEAQLNALAYTRYFDRPEVRRAYKEQQLIQTPDFTELPQDAHVGGRFRPRGSEDETVDTSDAAYEKRHRKYETFEKRQRLREKEKLKHEHYKLKERIEQLRAMDTTAFLAIPASEFTEARSLTPVPPDLPDEPVDLGNLHGAAAYHEGERRRKEMLEVALSLEQRYRTLLPPDRRWMEKKSGKPVSKSASVTYVEEDVDEEMVDEDGEPEVAPSDAEEDAQQEEEEEEEEAEEEQEDEEEEEVDELEDDGESEIDPEEIERRKSKQLKLRIKFPPGMLSSRPKQEPSVPPTRGGGKQITLSPFFKHTSGGKGPMAASPLHSVSYTSSKYGRYSADAPESLPQVPSKKRQRVETSASTKSKAAKAYNGSDTRDSISSAGLAGKKEPNICVLMVAAIRQSSAPSARKTQRHVTAFGTRVPPEIEEVRDFEIPHWVLASGSASEGGDRQGSYDNSFSYVDDRYSESEEESGT